MKHYTAAQAEALPASYDEPVVMLSQRNSFYVFVRYEPGGPWHEAGTALAPRRLDDYYEPFIRLVPEVEPPVTLETLRGR